VPSNSNFPASHVGAKPALFGYRAFSPPPLDDLHDYPSYAVATNRATSINAIAIMTNAVETNRILGSPFKLVYGTSLSSELYRDLFSP
jgi:hypothetical protein